MATKSAAPSRLGVTVAKPVPRQPSPPIQAEPAHSDPPKAIKIEQAKEILRAVGLTLRGMTARAQDRVALCLLGLARIPADGKWSDAKNHFEGKVTRASRAREILAFRNQHYQEGLARGAYDNVRRRELVMLASAGLVSADAEDAADLKHETRRYALTPEGVRLLRAFGTPGWEQVLKEYRDAHGDIQVRLAEAEEMRKVPVRLPGGPELRMAPGPHHMLQKIIVEEFLPRFTHDAKILFFGDAENNTLFANETGLAAIGLPSPRSGERLPDIIAHEMRRNWVFLIEAVQYSKPIDDARHAMLSRITAGCAAGRVFVTAFLTRKEFQKWVSSIAWETEVWIAENPTHMIHFDGERFLGPHGN